MDLCIVKASPENFKLLGEMDASIFPKSDRFEAEDFRDYENFLVRLNGTPIGSIVLSHDEDVGKSYDSESPSAPGVLHIVSTALYTKFRRRGIGSVLKAWEIAYAKKHEFKEIVTSARKSNSGSINLNKKFGFHVARTISGYYENPKEDAVVMRLSLGD